MCVFVPVLGCCWQDCVEQNAAKLCTRRLGSGVGRKLGGSASQVIGSTFVLIRKYY